MSDLSDFAATALAHIRENFPRTDEQTQTQQVLCLAEEAGEFVGAYRRWAGLARRSGTFEDMAYELADVVITAYVTAEAFGIGGKFDDFRASLGAPLERDAAGYVRALFAEVGAFVNAYDRLADTPPLLSHLLAAAVNLAYTAADPLGIDLDMAVHLKQQTIMSRGWREATTETRGDQP